MLALPVLLILAFGVTSASGPSITVSPTAASVGTPLMVTGDGFTRGSTGYAQWDGVAIEGVTFRVGARGDVAVGVRVPADAHPGVHVVTLLTGTSNGKSQRGNPSFLENASSEVTVSAVIDESIQVPGPAVTSGRPTAPAEVPTSGRPTAPAEVPTAAPTVAPAPAATPAPIVISTPIPDPTQPWSVPFGSRPASGPIHLSNCSNVVIENVTFRDLGASVIPIRIYGCDNVTIRSVDFINVKQGVYALNSTNVRVVDSRYSNITGPAQPRMTATANFVQFDKVSGGLIARNKGKGGNTEDIVSVYMSSNVTVEDNHFEGTNWTSTTGSGIALGDGGGSNNIARRNILVNPGQVGAFIAGGQNNQITNNIIISEQRPISNVGTYVWDLYQSGTCSGHTLASNRVLWYREDGKFNAFWNHGSCGTINGLNTNSWNDTTLNIGQYRVGL